LSTRRPRSPSPSPRGPCSSGRFVRDCPRRTGLPGTAGARRALLRRAIAAWLGEWSYDLWRTFWGLRRLGSRTAPVCPETGEIPRSPRPSPSLDGVKPGGGPRRLCALWGTFRSRAGGPSTSPSPSLFGQAEAERRDGRVDGGQVDNELGAGGGKDELRQEYRGPVEPGGDPLAAQDRSPGRQLEQERVGIRGGGGGDGLHGAPDRHRQHVVERPVLDVLTRQVGAERLGAPHGHAGERLAVGPVEAPDPQDRPHAEH